MLPGHGGRTKGTPRSSMADLLNDDTVPQRAVDFPMSDATAARAVQDVASALLIRAIVAAGATVLLMVATVQLFRHGIRPDNFPPFLAGTTRTVITRYSPPWIAGAAGTAVLAALSFTSFSADLFRRVRLQRLRRRR